MSTQQLLDEAMALPLQDRVALAQSLWESVDSDFPVVSEQEAIAQARARDKEIDAGESVVRPYEEVMQAARRALECE